MIYGEKQLFTTLFTCCCTTDDVHITWNPAPLKLPEAMHKQVLQHWDSLPKDFIFNGRLARLDRWSVALSSCRLELRPSDYRTLLYSNHHVKYIRDTWGGSFLSRVLGISAVVVSVDNFLIFIKRSANVGEYPECYDVFGGHIDAPQNGETPNVFNAMAQELEEEVGLQRSEFDLKLIGLIESTPNAKPELVFWAHVFLTEKDILSRANAAKDHIEFSQVHTLANNAEHIESFLKANQGEFSPSAFGSFCTYLRSSLTDVRVSSGNEKW